MSKEIDEKVVSMQFDNRNFEANVKTTMSTLDKLREKLHFKGVTKGLDDLSRSTSKFNMNPLANSVEAVSVKFSAMQVAGVAAITNLTNSAVNAGKRIVSALTIDPVKTGFSEYELKMDSVKTIMASTGEELATVNKYLEELNEYSDQTIYSFSDMTQNIGKFTNAGVKLEDAVLAIKGISNEAALSGANANEASRAMYNFAQALSVGYIQRIDWKSIELANMATVEFKEQLLDAAIAAGTVKKNADGMYETLAHPGKAYNASAMFTETLDDQWLTTEVLISTLKEYSDATTDVGKRAFAAAQDVTKMTQMFDVLKETAQSGWAKTWEIIFGDIEQAKAVFTPMTEFFSKIINSMSDFRNNLLEGALSNPFEALISKLDKSGLGTIKKYLDATSAYADKLEYFQKVVNDVWRGDYNNHGDNPDRYDLLDAAGYNHKVVQSLVNKGYLYKLTVDDIKAAHEKFGVSLEGTTSVVNETAIALEDLTDEQLRNAGFTEEEIKLFRELAKEAKRTGKPLKELVDEMSKVDGRTLLVKSFQNIGNSLVNIFTAIKDAWVEIFPPMTSMQLYNIIKAFNQLTEKLSVNDVTAGKLKRTLKGVFAIIDIITTVTGGALKIALKAIAKVLGVVDIDILDVTANIGDFLVALRDTIDELNIFEKGIEVIIPYLSKLGTAIRKWVKGLRETDNVPKYIIESLINGFKKGGQMAVNAAINLAKLIIRGIERVFGVDIPGGKFVEIGKNIIAGLNNGIFDGAKVVIDTIVNLGKKLIAGIKDVLDIHSPSKVFFAIGTFIVAGLLLGLQNGSSSVLEFIQTLGNKCIELIKSLDLGTIFAGIVGVGMTVGMLKFTDALQSFAAPLEGLGDMLESVGEMLEDVGKGLKSLLTSAGWKMKADALLTLAFAIAVLAGSLFVLSKINTVALWNSVGAVSVLIILMGGLLALVNKSKDIQEMNAKSTLFVKVAAAILIMAIAMEKLAGIDTGGAIQAIIMIGAMVLAMGSLLKAVGGLSKPETMAQISKVGSMLIKLSIALLLMTAVVAIAGHMNGNTVMRGIAVIGGVSLLFAAIIGISKLAGQYSSSSGGMILKMSLALLVIIGVVKLAAKLDQNEVNKGIEFIASVLVLFGAFTILTSLASAVGKNASKVGTMMLKMSFALLIMVGIIKLISMMSQSDIEKGLGAITVLMTLFAAIIGVSALTAAIGKEASKIGSMMIKISIAMLLMVGVVAILSLLKPDALERAVSAIAKIELLFMGIIYVTSLIPNGKDADNTVKILTRLIVVIGLMALIVAGLSFIDPARLGIATAALSALMLVFTVLMKATKSMKVDKKLQTQMLWLVGVVGALGLVIGLLSLTKPERAIASAISLSIVMLAFSKAMVIMSDAVTKSQTIYKRMGALVAVVGALAVILGIFSNYTDPSKSVPSAIALSILLLSLTESMNILRNAVGITKKTMENVGWMTAVVLGLAVILGAMDGFGVEASIPTAISLGLLINAMATAMSILSKVGPTAQLAVPATAVLIEVVSLLGGFLLALGGLNELLDGGISWLISSGGEVLEQIGVAIGKFIGGIFGGISEGVYAGMPGIGESLSQFAENAAGFFTLMENIKPESVESVKLLSDALLTLTASNVLNSLMDMFGGSTIEDFGTQMGELGKGLKVFATETQGINSETVKSAASAVSILAEVSNEIPKEGGFLQDIFGTVNVKKFGESLGDLGSGIKDFANEVKDINPETVEAAASAGESLAEVTNALPKEGGIMQDIFGNVNIVKWSANLQNFGAGMKNFAAEIANINPETVTAAASAGQALAEATNAIPKEGGIMQDIFGHVNISGFSGKLVGLGKGVAQFAAEVKGIDSDAVTAAASAGKALASISGELPKEDGWIQKIFGSANLDTFSGQLSAFGKGMKSFSDEVAGITDTQKTKDAAAAAASIAGVAKVVQESESVWDYFTDNDTTRLSNFGGQLEELGKGMTKFADAIAGITDIGKVSTAAAALKDIAVLAQVLSESETWFEDMLDMKDDIFVDFGNKLEDLGGAMDTFYQKIKFHNMEQATKAVGIASKLVELIQVFVVGETAIGEVAAANLKVILEEIGSLGTGIETFYNKVKYLDLTKVTESVVIIEKITAIVNSLPKWSEMTLAYLGGQMSTFASNMKTFCENMDSLDITKVSDSLDDVTTVTNKINTVLDTFSTQITNREPIFKNAGIQLMGYIVDGINATSEEFYTAGENHIAKLKEGVDAQSESATIAFNNVIHAILLKIKNEQRYMDFQNTGKYLVQGFTSGINIESEVARLAAETMATRVLSTINAVFGVESPSKEMYETAMFCNQGFANGMDDTAYKSVKSVDRMADSVKMSFTNAITRVKNMLENGVDTQPTIRPVLDLSDVTMGARSINGLFNTNPTIGVMSNVRAISSTMNKRQNGGNSEVVSAIKDLEDSINSRPTGDTYSIDGITYSDGSEVSNAIKVLTRYAKMERRR